MFEIQECWGKIAKGPLLTMIAKSIEAETSPNCTYWLDKDNRIIRVDNRWLAFAEENEGIDSCLPELVINRPLWDFIHDQETRHLYEIIIEKVRSRGKPLTIPFRCDSPSKRRYLELTISVLPGGELEFQSTLLKVESREPVELLRESTPRSDEHVRICSFCKKVALSKTEWVEVEEAVRRLGLFERTALPQLTHGACPACHRSIMADLLNL
jgi:hypothetical protein